MSAPFCHTDRSDVANTWANSVNLHKQLHPTRGSPRHLDAADDRRSNGYTPSMQPDATTRGTLRIGAVSYLNSKPLVHGLAEAIPHAEIRYDLPSRLADDLASNQLDVALVPIVEYLRQPDFQLISNACVACRGPVLSVKLFFRTAPANVKRLALDEGSRTSAALAQLLLAKLHNLRPQLAPLPIGSRLEDADADAVLLIGDRAMQVDDAGHHEVWDLGDRWCRWAELPFVFAAWVARPNLSVDAAPLAAALEQVRDAGVASIDSIATNEAGQLGLSSNVAREYLTSNLHFTLGCGEQRGMEHFASLCHGLQLLTSTSPTPLCSSVR